MLKGHKAFNLFKPVGLRFLLVRHVGHIELLICHKKWAAINYLCVAGRKQHN